MQPFTDKHTHAIERFQTFLRLTPLLAITLLVGIESQAARQSSLQLMSAISDICNNGDTRALCEFVSRTTGRNMASVHKDLTKKQLHSAPHHVHTQLIALPQPAAHHRMPHRAQATLASAFAHSVQIRAPSA